MRTSSPAANRRPALFEQTCNKLEAHSTHPFVANAPDAIARNLGRNGIEDLHQYFRDLTSLYRDGRLPTRLTFKDILTYSPSDCELDLASDFHAIYIALKLLFEDLRGTKILQIASNYGPFLHFLKEVEGAKCAVGIDVNMAAARYAGSSNVPVVVASSSALPFPTGFFDCVISRHFLDWQYLEPVIGRSLAGAFITATSQQIGRVLKPGGEFISFRDPAVSKGGPIPGAGFQAIPLLDPFPDEKGLYPDLHVFQKS